MNLITSTVVVYSAADQIPRVWPDHLMLVVYPFVGPWICYCCNREQPAAAWRFFNLDWSPGPTCLLCAEAGDR